MSEKQLRLKRRMVIFPSLKAFRNRSRGRQSNQGDGEGLPDLTHVREFLRCLGHIPHPLIPANDELWIAGPEIGNHVCPVKNLEHNDGIDAHNAGKQYRGKDNAAAVVIDWQLIGNGAKI
jgi:hypothetical protein